MILDETDVFWRKFMDLGPPSVRLKEPDHYVMIGICVSRFVEYLGIWRFDCGPELFQAHVQEATAMLWMRQI